MYVVLGFGCVEEKEREKIKQSLQERATQQVLDEWNNKADEYDEMPRETAPERYTRFWYYDDTLIFHHINRRHAMSPDGWAVWRVEEEFVKDYEQEG